MHQTHCTWQQLSFFFSSQNVQRYLARCYEKSSIQNAEKKKKKKRFGQADEIAKGVVYLCRDGAYITGQQLNINGGLYM